MKRFFNYILLLLLSSNLFSTNYYLSLNGNDSNNGTSPATAWRSIQKLNTKANLIQAGDSVFFRRGDRFFGRIEPVTSGTLNQPIVYTAYGSGASPIISGSQTISNWTKLSGSKVWSANVTADTVAFLFMNDQRQTLARYPNTGYLKVTTGDFTQLTSNDLTQGLNYWKNATVRMRTRRWTYEARRITQSTASGKLTFDRDTRYALEQDWGFFIDNKYQELDMPGEWYYDHANAKIYFWPPNGVNPNTQVMEGSNYDYGFIRIPSRPLSHYRLQHLTFADQYETGVRFASWSNQNNEIDHCTFLHQGVTGVFMAGDNMKITNSTFDGQLGRGIKIHEVHGGDFSNNVLRRIGMEEGYGFDANQNMNGFHITRSDNLLVSYNQIDSIGYTGISCYTTYSTIEKNVITNTNLRLDDGSAIYAQGAQSHNTVIQNNIIKNVVGFAEGTSNTTKSASHGIYMDQGASFNTILNNTVEGVATSGIFVNYNNHDHRIEGNILIDYGAQAFRLFETSSPNTHIDNKIKDNVGYSDDEEKELIYLISNYGTEGDMAIFEQNYLLNPYSDYVAQIGNFTNQRGYTLEEWAETYPLQAVNNYESPYHFNPYEVNQELSGELVQNGNFTNNTLPWNFSTEANIVAQRLVNSGLDGPGFELGILGNVNTATIEQTINGLTQNSYYRLSYSVLSNGYGTCEIIFLTLQNQVAFKLVMPYTKTRRDQEVIFQLPVNLPSTRFGFRLKVNKGDHIVIDNVSLKKVAVTPDDPSAHTELFTNATNSSKTYQLSGTFSNLDGTAAGNSLSVPPYSSKLLFKAGATTTTTTPTSGPCTLDSLWDQKDFGNTVFPGEVCQDGQQFTIKATGYRINKKWDNFHYLYRPLEGDGTISMKVTSMSQQRAAEKTGLMFREELTGNGKHVFVGLDGDSRWHVQNRAQKNTPPVISTGALGATPLPYYFKIERQGNTFRSYRSVNGTQWDLLKTETLSMPSLIYVGIATTSFDLNTQTEVIAEDVTVVQGTTGPPPSGGCTLNPGWTDDQIGASPVAGAVCYDAGLGTYTLDAAGLRIDAKWDRFYYVHQTLLGDGEIIARVNSIGPTTAASVGGIMIREGLKGNAKNAFLGITADGRLLRHARTANATPPTRTVGGVGTTNLPQYVRLVRQGNTFRYYASSNGSNWNLLGTETIPMQNAINIGLAATSYDADMASTMVFDQVSVVGAQSTSIQAPELELSPNVAGLALNWESAAIRNQHFFTLERSADGVLFEMMTQLEAVSQSGQTHDYSFVDAFPMEAGAYYRLKWYRETGVPLHSSIVQFQRLAPLEQSLTVYPNPVVDRHLNIAIEGVEIAKILQTLLLDQQGRVIAEIPVFAPEVAWKVPASIPAGQYFLLVRHQSGQLQQQISLIR